MSTVASRTIGQEPLEGPVKISNWKWHGQWEKAQQQECWGSQDQECAVHGTETGPKGD